MTTLSAAEANRHFSQVLRQVARGETLIVTSRGKPMATIAPITRQAGRSLAQRQLLERLASQPHDGAGSSGVALGNELIDRLQVRRQQMRRVGSRP